MSTARHVAVGGALLLTLGGCRVFSEALLYQDGGDAPRDAGTDAGPVDASHDGGFDAGPACPLHRPPPRPAMPDDGESLPDIVFAFENIQVDQGDAWRTIGYDLDGLCSIGDAPEVECFPPAASGVPEIDGEGGIDNVLGHQIAPLIVLQMPTLQFESVRDMHNGIGPPVLIVRGWNGEDDDSRVEVIWSQADFGTPGLADGGVPTPMIPEGGIIYEDGGVPPLPAWDGNDYWWVRADFFLDGDPTQPLIRDDNAYVAGRTLVLRLPNRVPLIFSGSVRALVVRLTDGIFTADISDDNETATAVLAGRWPVSDGLTDLVHANICLGTDQHRMVSRVMDLTADVRAVPGTGGRDVACDAVSIGTTFDGRRAHFGGVSDRFEIPTPCDRPPDAGVPDAGLDAGMDGG